MAEVVGQATGSGRNSRARREEIEVELVGQASRDARARREEVKDDQLRKGYMLRVVELKKRTNGRTLANVPHLSAH